MTRLLLGSIALAVSTLGFGCSPKSPEAEQSSAPVVPKKPKETAIAEATSPQSAVQKALEVGKDDPAQAILILQKALKTTPKDREALLLLGVISVIEGEKTEDKEKRISLFHQAYAALSAIKHNETDLNAAEKGFQARIDLGEARALALQGKTTESFAILKGLMASGNGDFDSIDTVEDLRSVQDLPEFQSFAASLYGPKLAEAKKEIEAELAAAKPFVFDFKLKDLDGKTVTLADYLGKLTIVDLWGTWCPPCRKEIPHFVALSKKYKDQGLEIVGINCNEVGTEDEIKKTIRDFVKAYKIDYKCLLSDDLVVDRVPDLKGFPTTLFIDRSGKPRLVFYQGEPKAKIEAAITTLLAEGAKAP